jgi:CRISPR system Cascade subunit CasC
VTERLFLQIHSLTSYPASLLNRDDVGFAKRIPFGGVTRTRVSSQCLKRHWRTYDGEHALSRIPLGEGGKLAPLSVRSRLTFEKYIKEPLVAGGVAPDVATAATAALMAEVLGKSAKAKVAEAKQAEGKKAPKKGKGEAPVAEVSAADEPDKKAAGLQTGQVTVLGRPELEFLLAEAKAICAETKTAADVDKAVAKRFTKERKKNLKELRLGAGLDAALFGRMVTSDILARGDAAVHVAHAFTVHGEAAESDYFSAVDDLLKGGDDDSLGSGHIGQVELTTGLFYGYVVVDVPLLVSNLEGPEQEAWRSADRRLAAEVVERLGHLIATVSPGAKLGSTAPHAYAQLLMLELGSRQPRTLANAFLKPVADRGDQLAEAYQALATHLGQLDTMYGKSTERRFAALGDPSPIASVAERVSSLDALAGWAKGRLVEA